MLDLRWACVCAALIGCTSEATEGPLGDARVRDAMAQDAAVQDRMADGALPDAGLDASTADASSYVPGAMRSWRDVPAGPALKPREVCARTWQVPQQPIISGFGSLPVVHFTQALVHPDGTTLVAGNLLEPFDLGTGLLAMDAQSSTFVLALDAACELLWAHDYPGDGALALGLDAERHAVVATRTGGQSTEAVELLTLDASGGVLAQKAFSTSGSILVTASASRDGYVLISHIAQDQRGYNVLLRSDGTMLRQDLLGTVSSTVMDGQSLGMNGELIGSGTNFQNYYGTPFVGSSLAKVSAAGTLAWKVQLYPPDATTFDLVEHHVAMDGTIAVDAIHGNVSDSFSAHTIREVAPDGALRWDVPITRAGSLQVLEVRMGDTSVAAYGSFYGPTRVGNSELSVEDTDYRGVLMQLDRGGALRWALTLGKSESVRALELNARDEVVVAGDAAEFLAGPVPAFVRVYAF